MKKFRVMALLLVLLMVISMVMAGCAKDDGDAADAPKETTKKTEEKKADTKKDEPKSDETGMYTFTHYFNYDWWGLKPWGEDTLSALWSERFQIHIEFQKPDADASAKLNLMITSGDLPDSIMMDRGAENVDLVKTGYLIDLEKEFFGRHTNYQDAVGEVTRDLLRVEGGIYGIPNWPRKGATGGNDAWLYNSWILEDAGMTVDDLATFEGMYAYAVAARDLGTTRSGKEVVPFTVNDTSDGHRVAKSFYRSNGGLLEAGWYTIRDGKLTWAFKDAEFKQSIMEANKWSREGLIRDSQFTETRDEILEKIIAGRVALMYYDHSNNESNRFYNLHLEEEPGNSYQMVLPFPYPPANGLSTDDIYPDVKATVGWNVTAITTLAEQPERIYDFWTYLLTPEAAPEQMYGPEGILWEGKDANGLPIMKKAESEFTEADVNDNGVWFWCIPGQSDNIDGTKFAVNNALPEEKQNWVIKHQANVLTPIMWVSDEFSGLDITIDSQSPDGVARTLCEDHFKAELPKIIMAETVEEAEALYQGVLDFCEANGYQATEDAYAAKHADYVAKYGSGVSR